MVLAAWALSEPGLAGWSGDGKLRQLHDSADGHWATSSKAWLLLPLN